MPPAPPVAAAVVMCAAVELDDACEPPEPLTPGVTEGPGSLSSMVSSPAQAPLDANTAAANQSPARREGRAKKEAPDIAAESNLCSRAGQSAWLANADLLASALHDCPLRAPPPLP